MFRFGWFGEPMKWEIIMDRKRFIFGWFEKKHYKILVKNVSNSRKLSGSLYLDRFENPLHVISTQNTESLDEISKWDCEG